MKSHLLPALALAFAIGATDPLAEASAPGELGEWERDWTVLTMAADGAWGVATHAWIIQALAQASDRCRALSSAGPGCGAHFMSIRGGWMFGIRCGDKNIIVAEASRDDAEFSAAWREHELRMLYYPDMPPCVRLVTVNPQGSVVTEDLDYARPVYSWQ